MAERGRSREPTVTSRVIDIAESAQVCGNGDLEKPVASLLDDLVSGSISLDSYLEQCGGLLGLAFHKSTDDVQFRERQEQVLEKVFSCPPTPPHWALLFLCECLGAAGPRSLPYFNFAVRLLMAHVEKDGLEHDLRAGMNEEGKGFSPRDAKQLSVCLCRVPQRVGNALRKLAPAALFPDKLFSSTCRALVRAAAMVNLPSTLKSPLALPAAPSFPSSSVHCLWVALASQLILAGRAKDLANCLLYSAVIGELTPQRHSDLLQSLPLDSAYELVSELIYCAGQKFSLRKDVVGNTAVEIEAGEEEEPSTFNCWIKALEDGTCKLVKESGKNGRLFHLLSHRMLLAVPFPPPHLKGVMVALVGVLSGSELLLEALNRVSCVWAEPAFVHRSPHRCQAFVTEFILEASKRLGMSSELNSSSECVLYLIRGVGVRLGMSNLDIRRQGLLVGETVSHIVGEPISFDELRHMEERNAAAKEIETCNDDHVNKKKTAVLTAAIDVSSSVEEQKEEKTAQQQYGAGEPDWDDPDCVLLPLRVPPRESEAMAPVLEKNKDGDENEDPEDEPLLPYDPPLPRKAKLPQYLHHVISRLEVTLDNDSWESQKSALVALPMIISRNPPDLQHYCSRLLRDLVFLEDRFGIPDFEELRVEGMIAVSTSEPCTAAISLSNLFFDSSTSVGSKYLILHVLIGTAKRLSKIDSREAILNGKSNRSSGTTAVSQRLGKNTRRWGRRQERTTQLYQNRFTMTAPAFVYGLLRGCTVTRTKVELWGHADSAPLLAKVLGALSCFMECTSTGYAAETLGKDVAWFAWAFRNSLHAELRASVVVVICTVAAISPRALEGAGFGEAECHMWLKGIEREVNNEGSVVSRGEVMPLLRRNLLPAELKLNQIGL